MQPNLLIEREGRVLRLTLNRPDKRNALDQSLCEGLVLAVENAQQDTSIGAILLSATGDVFCAGMDLQDATAPDAVERTANHERLFAMGAWSRKPIVAAVGGPALGGGVGLLANAHIVVASHGVSFGLTEIRLGLWPYLIYRSVETALGPRRTLELSLTGRIFQLPEAVQWGLVSESVPAIELDDRATALAMHLAGFSADALRSGLSFVERTSGQDTQSAAHIALEFRAAGFASADFHEGVAAFLEKRRPVWRSHSACLYETYPHRTESIDETIRHLKGFGMEQLQELLVEELRDLYDAEKQITRALPKMAKAATTEELKQCFLTHLEQTKGQVTRIEQVFELLGERAKSKPCKAMQGLIEEGKEAIEEHEPGEMLDNVLITGSQKIEHYEIAGYGSVRTLAKAIGNKEAANLLNETLKEEGETDKLLTQVALKIQKSMMTAKPVEAEEEGEGEQATPRSGKKKVAKPEKKARGNTAAKSNENGAGSNVTTDHEFIRQWAEERKAQPSCVRGTGKKGDVGLLRLDFPGYSGADKLEPIEWEEFFEKFDDQGLALLYQEHTAAGERSNFNKLISRGETGGKKGGSGKKKR